MMTYNTPLREFINGVFAGALMFLALLGGFLFMKEIELMNSFDHLGIPLDSWFLYYDIFGIIAYISACIWSFIKHGRYFGLGLVADILIPVLFALYSINALLSTPF